MYTTDFSLFAEFDQELYDKNRRHEGYEEGNQDGLIEGAHKNAVENVKRLLKE